jgi:hypothetical protein
MGTARYMALPENGGGPRILARWARCPAVIVPVGCIYPKSGVCSLQTECDIYWDMLALSWPVRDIYLQSLCK